VHQHTTQQVIGVGDGVGDGAGVGGAAVAVPGGGDGVAVGRAVGVGVAVGVDSGSVGRWPSQALRVASAASRIKSLAWRMSSAVIERPFWG